MDQTQWHQLPPQGCDSDLSPPVIGLRHNNRLKSGYNLARHIYNKYTTQKESPPQGCDRVYDLSPVISLWHKNTQIRLLCCETYISITHYTKRESTTRVRQCLWFVSCNQLDLRHKNTQIRLLCCETYIYNKYTTQKESPPQGCYSVYDLSPSVIALRHNNNRLKSGYNLVTHIYNKHTKQKESPPQGCYSNLSPVISFAA